MTNSANDVVLNADHVTATDDGGNVSPVSSHVGVGHNGDTNVTVCVTELFAPMLPTP